MLYRDWLTPTKASSADVTLFAEVAGQRATGISALRKLVGDHFVGIATVVKAGGLSGAADVIRNSLPTNKRTRSGDFAEMLASEYVDAETPYRVPIKKLRWKSDRQMPMHGNDIVAVDDSDPAAPKVLKGECKSRKAFGASAVSEAIETLDKFEGRPNPSTVAFITKRLYEAGKDGEADLFRRLQGEGGIAKKAIRHLVFGFSAKDPSAHLETAFVGTRGRIPRDCVAVVVADYENVIVDAFTIDGE